MTKHIILFIGLVSMALLLSECKSTKSTTAVTPMPASTAPMEEKPAAASADAVDISAGQTLFTTKCNDCHKLPNPKAHDEGAWANIMVKMSRKAKLTPIETAQVLKYISSARSN